MNNYIIGSGFWAPNQTESKEKQQSYLERQEFLNIWIENILKYSNPLPKQINIINSNATKPKINKFNYSNIQWIDLLENPGHSISTDLKICGWRSSILISALIAYSSRCDLIYKEQDCLYFGNIIEQIYKESKGNKILTGRFKSDANLMAEISLMYVPHKMLFKFIETLSNIIENEIIKPNYPEKEIALLIDMLDGEYFTFGYGRDRPINFDDNSFFIQHIGYDRSEKAQKLFDELKNRKLI
jgi:hypothetical protein